MSMLSKFSMDMKRHNFKVSINYWEPYGDIKEEKKRKGGILLSLEPLPLGEGNIWVIKIGFKLKLITFNFAPTYIVKQSTQF
jgi:hypothetical protein